MFIPDTTNQQLREVKKQMLSISVEGKCVNGCGTVHPETRLVYRASPGVARATERGTISKQNTEKQTENSLVICYTVCHHWHGLDPVVAISRKESCEL